MSVENLENGHMGNTFKFLAPKLWNTLDDDLRVTANVDHFGNNIDLSALCELSRLLSF